jgi:prepilin-type N-terminal cleavage/methylation domain-containing protein/prepilin-type processing-associated H-X9-DG protein
MKGLERRSKKSRRSTNVGKGFTLIELLVVIAIIAILAAILFPVFARARENAKKTTGLSNSKQLALGVIQYTQDDDERYPIFQYGFKSTEGQAYAEALPPGQAFSIPSANCTRVNTTTGAVIGGPGTCSLTGGNSWTREFHTEPASRMWIAFRGASGGKKWRTWQDFIFPYVKSLDAYDCPSRSYRIGWQDRHVHAVNAFMTGLKAIPPATVSDKAVNLAEVQTPSNKIWSIASNFNIYATMDGELEGYYFSDCVSGGNDVAAHRAALNAQFGGCQNFEQNYPTSWRTRSYPHNGGNIVTFADGHAKWYTRLWQGFTQNGGADSITGAPSLRGDQRYWDPSKANA